jgi:hypothetical protein
MNLGIYLSDHLAGAEAGCQLLARLTRRYPGGDLGRNLRELLAEIRADKRVLQDIAANVGASRPALKRAGGWLAERAGRVKLSFASAPDRSLSLFEGLELLSIGVLGKRALWMALLRVQESVPALKPVDFTGLAARAVAQFERLEAYRLLSAPSALRHGLPPGTSTAPAGRNLQSGAAATRETQPLRMRMRAVRIGKHPDVNGEKPSQPKARSH